MIRMVRWLRLTRRLFLVPNKPFQDSRTVDYRAGTPVTQNVCYALLSRRTGSMIICPLCAKNGQSATTTFPAFLLYSVACFYCGPPTEPSCRVVTASSPLNYAVSKLRLSESGRRQVLRCVWNTFAAGMPCVRRIESPERKILQRVWRRTRPANAASGSALKRG